MADYVCTAPVWLGDRMAAEGETITLPDGMEAGAVLVPVETARTPRGKGKAADKGQAPADDATELV